MVLAISFSQSSRSSSGIGSNMSGRILLMISP
jgi:hypothetical protein